ncbi:unnamed protein product [Prorocentrum cordatum]|uniref:Uncharacterized protein n=1 Tax=Prorocentrum cordatum TaxID=2364126 RepID=A0ABN9U0W6_9DINO|nr:unnamed protein product [Polarella glacialis]
MKSDGALFVVQVDADVASWRSEAFAAQDSHAIVDLDVIEALVVIKGFEMLQDLEVSAVIIDHLEVNGVICECLKVTDLFCECMEVTVPTLVVLEVPVGICECVEVPIVMVECEKVMDVTLGLEAIEGLEEMQGLAVVKGLDASVGVPGPGGDHRNLRVSGVDACSEMTVVFVVCLGMIVHMVDRSLGLPSSLVRLEVTAVVGCVEVPFVIQGLDVVEGLGVGDGLVAIKGLEVFEGA